MKNRRVESGDGDVSDPHVPLVRGKPYRVIKGRRFDYRVQHASLFGSVDVTRPRILDLAPPYRSVRICAIGTDPPGKTSGYWEAQYSATRSSRGFRLAPQSGDDRPADLSGRMLDTLKRGSTNCLYPALMRLFDNEQTIAFRDVNLMRDGIGQSSVQLVLDLLQGDPDLEKEANQMNGLVAEACLRVFAQARTTAPDYLKAAEAESMLLAAINRHLGGTMTERSEIPHLARQTHAIIGEMVTHLTPDDKARLRTMSLSEPPLSFWVLMGRVPPAQTDDELCIEVWKVVLRGLGSMTQTQQPAGRTLADTGFPGNRMSRLLVATGTTLSA